VIEPAGGEALEGGLVAGGDRDARAGAKVGEVGRDDRLRLVREQARRPETVVQAVAGRLQLGGEAAVDDDDAAGGEQRRERVPDPRHPRQPALPMSIE
jgi:hypothetical protein